MELPQEDFITASQNHAKTYLCVDTPSELQRIVALGWLKAHKTLKINGRTYDEWIAVLFPDTTQHTWG